MRFLGIVVGLVLPIAAAPPDLRKVASYPAPELFRGGAADPEKPERFLTWGRAAHVWDNGRPHRRVRALPRALGVKDGDLYSVSSGTVSVWRR